MRAGAHERLPVTATASWPSLAAEEEREGEMHELC